MGEASKVENENFQTYILESSLLELCGSLIWRRNQKQRDKVDSCEEIQVKEVEVLRAGHGSGDRGWDRFEWINERGNSGNKTLAIRRYG